MTEKVVLGQLYLLANNQVLSKGCSIRSHCERVARSFLHLFFLTHFLLFALSSHTMLKINNPRSLPDKIKSA